MEEVFLNVSSLSPNTLYLKLYATLSDSLASGLDTILQTLIDSGSSHCNEERMADLRNTSDSATIPRRLVLYYQKADQSVNLFSPR